MAYVKVKRRELTFAERPLEVLPLMLQIERNVSLVDRHAAARRHTDRRLERMHDAVAIRVAGDAQTPTKLLTVSPAPDGVRRGREIAREAHPPFDCQ